MSLYNLYTVLFEIPLSHMAWTSSSIHLVETPSIQASYITATKGLLKSLAGFNEPGKVATLPKLRHLKVLNSPGEKLTVPINFELFR